MNFLQLKSLWKKICASSEIIGVDVDCPNKDGITPMYLALFIGGDSCEWHSPWCKVVDVIKSYGGTLRYPSLEAEYFLVYNIFFGMNPSKLFLELTEDEILTLQEGCGCDERRKYKAANVNLFKTSDEVDRFPEEGGPMFFIYRRLSSWRKKRFTSFYSCDVFPWPAAGPKI